MKLNIYKTQNLMDRISIYKINFQKMKIQKMK